MIALSPPLLEVKGLSMHFPITEGIVARKLVGEVKAVDGIDFTVRRGETLGLVGESGCGKTTTGRCILRLERPTAGEIVYDGVDIAQMGRKALLGLRRRIQVVCLADSKGEVVGIEYVVLPVYFDLQPHRLRQDGN